VISLSGIDRRSFDSLPVVMSPQDVADFLDVSLNTIYEELRQKRISFVKVGRQYRIPRKALAKFLGIDQD
jgi:excisionase family DNA binding protein